MLLPPFRRRDQSGAAVGKAGLLAGEDRCRNLRSAGPDGQPDAGGGCKRYQVRQALVVGGVASSKLLRELLRQRLAKLRCPVEIFFGDPRYSADNAAGVAELGLEQYRQWKEKNA